MLKAKENNLNRTGSLDMTSYMDKTGSLNRTSSLNGTSSLKRKGSVCSLVGLICMACLMLASCHSTKGLDKSSASTATSTGFSATQHFDKVKANNSQQQNLVSKVNVSLAYDDKSVSTSGSLKMKKDDVIQLSLVDPILGVMELGRIEFTKTHVLILDRVNKQYIDVPYSDVSFLQKANIDFNTLQSLFWNSVFEPGKSAPVASDFNYEQTSGNVRMLYKDKMLTYDFYTQPADGRLEKTSITSNSDKSYQCDFSYGDFSTFENKPFPKNMTMAFRAGSRKFSLSLSLGSIKNSSDWIARTSVPSKYSKADTEKILKQLIK